MRIFFSPAIALLNRLGYTSKFTLLWLTSLIAITVVVYSLYSSLDKEIRSSQRELEGIALATPISRTVQLLQEHRGLSAALLGGNLDMRDKRLTNEQNVAEMFLTLEKSLPTNLSSSEDWHSIRKNWELLCKDGFYWSADKNFAVHTRLIDQLLIFKVTVSGEYVLPLDPQIDTSYLIDTTINRLPMALEHLGQIRAYGTRILAARHTAESQKVVMNTLVAQFGDELKFLNINLEKAGRYNPALQGPLSAASRDISGLAQNIVNLVESDIMSGNFATPPETFFTLSTGAIDNSYRQMHESLLPMTEGLIKARITRAQNALLISIGLAALLFLVGAYLSIGIYYATIDSIQSLARSARAFAGGDMRERIDLGTQDELRQVCNSFNEMANGFEAMLAAQREGETRLRIILETALDAVVQMDAKGVIIGWNSQAEKIFGWSRKQAIGRSLGETIIPLRYRDAHAYGLQRFLESGDAVALNQRIELPGLHSDGSEFPLELTVTSLQIGNRYEFSAFIRDITKKKEAEELIWKQANFDALTGLPNRHMFYDRLAQEIRKAHRSGLPLMLLFIDLDKFKEVNDALGHDIGDTLLVEAARRISSCVRETDTVARIGGDEFTVILAELEDVNIVDALARNIIRKLAEPFQLGNEAVYVSASAGITLYPDDATEIDELLKNADLAMYVAKNLGRNRHSYFTPALQEAAQARLRLINDLRGALAANQFRVHFQPIVDLATGRINKAEALIRWQHPVRGLVAPAEFIPLSEETGLIVEIGDWVFKEAMRWTKRWRTLHHAEFQVSVNKSPMQFRHDGHHNCTTWPDYLRQMELPGQSLVIEITEGLLLDEESGITARLLEFHDAGIQVSVDDFGTGYSSLAYLKKFNIAYLKIDRSFTRNLAPGSIDMALSEAIIVMAHKLGLQVIAEGVETETQRELLASATACNYAQGYLFSKPLPPEEFELLLQESLLESLTPSSVENGDHEPFILSDAAAGAASDVA